MGGSDDEDDAEDDELLALSSASVAPYASMLAGDDDDANMPNAISSFEKVVFSPVGPQEQPFPTSLAVSEKKKNKKRKLNKRRTNKPSKWADKCMYAELLEMVSNDMWWSQGGLVGDEEHYNNGLPKDLETAWVALAPVPAGKRCLAVTHQSSGVAGIGE